MWHWQIVAPYTAGQIQFPKLPSNGVDWNPADGDDVSVEHVLSVKVPGGYDAVRAHALDVAQQFEPASLLGTTERTPLVAGATGRAVVVESLDVVIDPGRVVPRRMHASVNRSTSGRLQTKVKANKASVMLDGRPIEMPAMRPSASRMIWTKPNATWARVR
jgi:hypothetical protein